MATLQRLALSGVATLFAIGLTMQPALAATARPAATPKRIDPPKPAIAPAHATAAPLIFQINPAKVNPTVQPNIMILGQHLTPTSTVQVGGIPATTVQAPDPDHLLVKLPDNLSKGSYIIQVQNEAGMAVASDPLVVDNSDGQPSMMKYLLLGGALVLFVLVMRMARTPGIR